MQREHALRALEVLFDVVLAARELLTLAGDPHAAWVLEVDRVVVVDFARLARHPLLPAADAVGRDRHVVEEPVGDVDVVDVLLADVISAEPVEVVPVVHLILHLRLVGLAVSEPDATPIPIDLTADDVADHPFADLGESLAVVGLVATLKTDHDLQFLFVGQPRGFEHAPSPVAVDADGLLHEHVLAGLHGCVELERSEAGGRGEDHEVAGVDHPLVAVEPVVPPVFGAVDLVLHLVEGPHRAVDATLEGVGNCRELHVRAGHGERLHEGAAAAAAGADEAHLERLARRVVGVHAPHSERG